MPKRRRASSGDEDERESEEVSEFSEPEVTQPSRVTAQNSSRQIRRLSGRPITRQSLKLGSTQEYVEQQLSEPTTHSKRLELIHRGSADGEYSEGPQSPGRASEPETQATESITVSALDASEAERGTPSSTKPKNPDDSSDESFDEVEVAEVSRGFNSIKKALRKRKAKITSIRRECARLKKRLDKAGTSEAQLKEQIKTLKSEAKVYKQAIHDGEELSKKSESQVSSLRAANSRLDSKISKLQEDKAKLKEEKNLWVSKKSELHKVNSELKKEKKTLESEKKRHSKHIDDLSADIQAEEERRLALSHVDFDSKISDDTVQQEWRQLGFQIRQLVLDFLSSKTPDPVDEDEQTRELKERCKAMPYLQIFYLQNYIWAYLWEGIFRRSYGPFHRVENDAFLQLCHAATREKITHKDEFSALKVQLANWLDRETCSDNEAEFERMVADVGHNLHAFIGAENVEQFQVAMKKILHGALRISQIFRSSRAVFFVKFPSLEYSDKFDEDSMEIVYWMCDNPGDDFVEVVISPMVEKRGNADGHNLHICSIICKACVVVDKDSSDIINFDHERDVSREQSGPQTEIEDSKSSTTQPRDDDNLVSGGNGGHESPEIDDSNSCTPSLEDVDGLVPTQESLD